MLLIRRIHAYLGLLIAPSVLFFALSGGLQLFNLHKAHLDYKPPAIIEILGNLHKDQVVSKQRKRPSPQAGADKAASARAGRSHEALETGAHDHEPRSKLSTLVLKWFFELVAVGLAFSTLLGLWIGLRFTRTPVASWACLIAGVAAPVLILFI